VAKPHRTTDLSDRSIACLTGLTRRVASVSRFNLSVIRHSRAPFAASAGVA